MEYQLNTILPFGKNRGYTIQQVYQFEPSYLEYLIECHIDFLIAIELFDALPKPTPYVRRYPDKLGGLLAFHPSQSQVKNAFEFLKNGGTIPSADFKFSDKHKDVIASKRNGTYVTPDRCNARESIPVEFFGQNAPRPKAGGDT
jgi:hypothetical protein